MPWSFGFDRTQASVAGAVGSAAGVGIGVCAEGTARPTRRRPDDSSTIPDIPAILQRKITARWKEWEHWVWMDLLQRGIDPLGSSEIAALRRQHSGHIVHFMRTGLTMRLIRRHRLDDPRITDELRRVLSWAVMERCSRASLVRHRSSHGVATQLAAAGARGTEPSKIQVAPRQVSPSQYRPVPIDLIQKKVREYFQLRELRDQDLGMRSNRQTITFPRQVAMYIAKQATGASLQEIGKQFGGRHHTTVLHSINKIERLRRSDENLNRTIARLIDALQQQ